MNKRRLRADGVPEPPERTFSNAFVVGGTIYVAGQTAGLPDGSVVGDRDVRAQTREVFRRIAALLAAGNATMEHVVKLTIYLTNMSTRAMVTEVRGEFFTGDFPASTLVEVSALALPGLLVEIEAIAVRDEGSAP